jgi:hypothetical protein
VGRMTRNRLSHSLASTLARGQYVVDTHAVAEAILDWVDDGPDFPFASGVLVAAERRQGSSGVIHENGTGPGPGLS